MMVTYKTGSNITLSCSAESNPPARTQWLFGGIYLDQYSSQLQLENVKENQTGTYKCLVYNTVTSRFASVSAMIRIVGKDWMCLSWGINVHLKFEAVFTLVARHAIFVQLIVLM